MVNNKGQNSQNKLNNLFNFSAIFSVTWFDPPINFLSWKKITIYSSRYFKETCSIDTETSVISFSMLTCPPFSTSCMRLLLSHAATYHRNHNILTSPGSWVMFTFTKYRPYSLASLKKLGQLYQLGYDINRTRKVFSLRWPKETSEENNEMRSRESNNKRCWELTVSNTICLCTLS